MGERLQRCRGPRVARTTPDGRHFELVRDRLAIDDDRRKIGCATGHMLRRATDQHRGRSSAQDLNEIVPDQIEQIGDRQRLLQPKPSATLAFWRWPSPVSYSDPSRLIRA